MYEMRAESSDDRRRLVWHVLAKDASASALCGFRLPAEPDIAPAGEEPEAEHYCAPCMDAFGGVVQGPPTGLSGIPA
ncbi:hypothetical protein [Streptomyces antimicrobicus]|uniref:Uncharacterized protein n=1 Tax=Streptomyces antimicrobicus TaxID=2883108 RepID=A0ABS8BFE9_9ACTN|nr:hypothetical protein [Streptomyces antimicrobicus]MCB5183345.1 hypothetical protein [Streptomyces antimicrobicus]